MLGVIAISVIIFQLLVILWLFMQLDKHQSSSVSIRSANTPQSVATFYDQTTDKFLEVYGEIIQAFRTNNVADYLNYTAQSMQLTDDMYVIDAGCGVCGPACHFAGIMDNLKIDAVTISPVQVEKCITNIELKNLQGHINIQLGDYHKLNEIFPLNSADRVYFLESFGHSNDKTKLIDAAFQVLKPGGKLYIKDLFLRESSNEWEQQRINEIAEQINMAYEYQIADLNEVLSVIRRKGFIVEFIRPPQVERDKFEHLTISNEFQNLFNIGKIDTWDNYVFPIDFFEILVEKPAFNLQEEAHLYFMNR